MGIILSSQILEVEEIVKKTQAKMFKSLKVGNKIVITIPIMRDAGRRGVTASYLTATNLITYEENVSSFKQMDTILQCFKFKAV
jgi:hypothetical protein